MATATTHTTTVRQMNGTRSRLTETMNRNQQTTEQALIEASTGNPLRGKEKECDVVVRIIQSRLLACVELHISNLLECELSCTGDFAC
jgi:hypothetical protein